MQTANHIAEREYDGGKEMSGQECLDRLAYAQRRKSWMLKNTETCFLAEWVWEEGYLEEFLNAVAREPDRSLDIFNDLMFKLATQADRMAMEEVQGLSWQEIQEGLSDAT